MLREVRELTAARGRIPLASPGTRMSHNAPGDPCELPGALATALGGAPTDGVRLCNASGRKLAVSVAGPSGSGRWWEIAIALTGPKGAVAGACIESATTAWRNIPPEVLRPGSAPRWDVCPGDLSDRLEIWDSVRSFVDADMTGYVLFSLVYRVEGDALVVDIDATQRRAAELSGFYRRTARTSRAALHVEAAAMLEAFASGSTCRLRGPRRAPAR
jgi:hypothetical protein